MKTTLKRVLAFMFAFAMVVSLLPTSILANESGETLVVDETVNVEAPTEVPAEEPAEEPKVEEQTLVVPAEAPAEEPKAEEPAEEPAVVAEGIGEVEAQAIVAPTATGNKITFNGNGGKVGSTRPTVTSTNSYEAGAEVSIAAALGNNKFTRSLSSDYSTNYRLIGWNTAKDGSGTQYATSDTLIMPETALTLYAQWEEYEWIHWNVVLGEGGDHIDQAKAKGIQSFKAYCGNSGTAYGKVPAAYYSPVTAYAQEGYTFIGWYEGDTLITKGNLTTEVFRNLRKLTMEESGTVLKAKFTDKIVVTYSDGVNGAAFADQVYYVEKGDATPAFEGTPAREHCDFLGWDPEVSETATESVTYVAQWKENIPVDPSSSTTPKELFTIHCTSDEDHPDEVWNWFGSHVAYNKDKAYNEERQVWTASAKVSMSQFLYEYQKDVNRKHYCTDASGNKISTVNIPLVWDEEQNLWVPDGGMTVINIWCYTAPAAPVASKITGTGIWVRDTDKLSNYTKYTLKQLLAGTYEIGEMYEKEDGTFWATLTVTNLQPYVDAFNKKYNANGSKIPYVIDGNKTTATFTYDLQYTSSTLEYLQDGSGWTATNYTNNVEKGNGKELWVFSRYIVTYTDGVEDEEIFADQVYYAEKDAATPEFDGTPTRENWDFMGWEPEVAETVTGNVTYVAQWEKSTKNKPAASKNLKKSEVDKMQLRAHALGTGVLSPSKQDWSCSPSIHAKGVSYTIGEIQGNDVDGYTTTVTFHFKSGDEFEADARRVFNTWKGYQQWMPDWNGNWSYVFSDARPADQTVTFYWTGVYSSRYNKWNYYWYIEYNGSRMKWNNSVIANLVHVDLALDRTVTYTDGVEDEEVFADQTYVVRNGSATPAFEGTPTRKGYRFEGWKPAVAEKVYADVTYEAQWVEAYTVTYTDGKKGQAFADEVYQVVPGEKTPAFAGTVTPGWTLQGWTPEVAETVTEDVTYTAKLKQGAANTLRLNGNGGLKNGYPTSDSYTNANYAVLRSNGSEFVNPGYTFKSWNTEPDGSGKTYKRGDQVPFEYAHNGEIVVLYAQWKQGPANTLRLDGNGGLRNGSTTYSTYTNADHYVMFTSDAYGFTREDYVFVGWNTEKDGSGTYYTKGDIIPCDVAAHNGEVKYLYAQWKSVHVTVTYTDGVNGEVFEDQVFELRYGDAVPAFEGTPVRKGYEFLGWDVEAPETLTDSITFTAQWKVVNDSDVPKTGDGERILRPAVLMGAMLLLGAGVAMTVVTKRRKQEN